MPASSDKWRYTLYTTLVVLILFNPWTYKLVNSLLSGLTGPICNSSGCPTTLGFIIHAIVFTFIVRYMMDLRI
jgi:hypothetical protein